MANLNKVMMIGRLASDPETRTFQNGGKVSKFRFAVNYTRSKKDPATGQWKDGETTFIDVDVFNKQWEGAPAGRQLADFVDQYLKKGTQVYIEGRLRMDQWEQDGQKRSKILVVADDIQFVEPRQDGSSGEGGGGFQPRRAATQPARPAATPAAAPQYDEPEPQHGGGEEGEIPF